MPSVSKAQQRLMQAAEHGADFPLAEKLRDTMTHQQLHDYASGSEQGKPEHVKDGRPAHQQAQTSPSFHTHRHKDRTHGLKRGDR